MDNNKQIKLKTNSRVLGKTPGAEYGLVKNGNILYLTRDGVEVPPAIELLGSTTFTGTLFRYRIFLIGYIPNENDINNDPLSTNYYDGPNWSKSFLNREDEDTEILWMATCEFVNNDPVSEWSFVRITSEKGEDGVDGTHIEYIYKLVDDIVYDISAPGISNNTAEKPIPTDNSWTDHPQGVDEIHTCEYYCYSTKQLDGTWSDFLGPFIWSRYGKNGHDGDGVEYIFALNNDEANSPVLDETETINGKTHEDDEYVPNGWFDNPQLVEVDQKIQWVAIRKRVNGVWQPFGTPVVWNKYLEPISADPSFSVYLNPIMITYPENGSTTYSVTNNNAIEIIAYLGLTKLPIDLVKIGSDDLTIDNDGIMYDSVNDRYYITSYTANSSSETNFRITSDTNTRDVTLIKSTAPIGVKGDFKSTAFTKTRTNISGMTPTGGSYDNPIPTTSLYSGATIVWHDSIPDNGTGTVWQTTAVFHADDTYSEWSHPVKLYDTETIDREFSPNEEKPNIPVTANKYPGGSVTYNSETHKWFDAERGLGVSGIDWTDMIWEAERNMINGVPDGDWRIFRIKGEDGKNADDSYLLSVSPSTYIVDVDHINTITLEPTVYKNGEKITSGYQINYLFYNNDTPYTYYTLVDSLIEVSYPSGKTIRFSNISPNSLLNGMYIKVTLTVNNQIKAITQVPILRNSLNLYYNFVLRDRGLWNENTTYYNESIDPEKVNKNIKYIDIVRYKKINNNEVDSYDYYMATKSVVESGTSPIFGNGWQKALSMDFAYIKTLVSDIIKALSAQVNELIIVDNDSNIEAGMTSGSRVSNTEDPNVRIWAGQTGLYSGGLYNIDLTTAPFKVYNDGKVVANNIDLALSTIGIDSDFTTPEWINGKFTYFYITGGTPTICTTDGSTLITVYNNLFKETTSLELDKIGMYMLCALLYNNKPVWLLTHVGFASITTQKSVSQQILIPISEYSVDNYHSDTQFVGPNAVKTYSVTISVDKSYTPLLLNSITFPTEHTNISSSKTLTIQEIPVLVEYEYLPPGAAADWQEETAIVSKKFQCSSIVQYTPNTTNGLYKFSMIFSIMANRLNFNILSVKIKNSSNQYVTMSLEDFKLSYPTLNVYLNYTCDVSQTSAVPAKELPNGTIINTNDNTVIGCKDGDEITTYSDYAFILPYNDKFVKVVPGNNTIDITDLALFNTEDLAYNALDENVVAQEEHLALNP